jgi:hypothetical protein
VSQGTVSLVERGRLDALALRQLRKVLAKLDAEVVVLVRWRDGEIDRLLDARHAALGGLMVERLQSMGWMVIPEVSYSIFGERGSIDLLAWHPPTRTLLVVELKSELGSLEETLRRHDAKVRLAPKVANKRFGWVATTVGRILVFPEHRTIRRQVERHDLLLRRIYPLRSVAMRRWLAAPLGPAAGLMFLPLTNSHRAMRDPGPRSRVGGPRSHSESRVRVA